MFVFLMVPLLLVDYAVHHLLSVLVVVEVVLVRHLRSCGMLGGWDKSEASRSSARLPSARDGEEVQT